MTEAMSSETVANLTPWQRYQKDLERPDFHKDPAQEDAVKRLQALYDKLVEAESERSKGGLSKLIQGYCGIYHDLTQYSLEKQVMEAEEQCAIP